MEDLVILKTKWVNKRQAKGKATYLARESDQETITRVNKWLREGYHLHTVIAEPCEPGFRPDFTFFLILEAKKSEKK